MKNSFSFWCFIKDIPRKGVGGIQMKDNAHAIGFDNFLSRFFHIITDNINSFRIDKAHEHGSDDLLMIPKTLYVSGQLIERPRAIYRLSRYALIQMAINSEKPTSFLDRSSSSSLN